MAIGWEHEKVGRRSAAAGAAYRNPLEGTGISRETKLAREAIQNSCDAAVSKDQAVKVIFRKRTLTGEAKTQFIEALLLEQLLEGRHDDLRLPESSVFRNLNDPDSPLPIMYVEDFNTTGLTGDPEHSDSKFFKFMFSLGDDEKAYDHAGTGGSFGFGKSVFANLSNCYSFFVYTCVASEHLGNVAHSRFMGASFFSKYRAAGEAWTGRAWLGVDQGGESYPASDELADEMASRTGCLDRRADLYGTTVVILGFDADLAVLRRGIEDFWWPRLWEHNLTVEIWDEDRKLEPPRPRLRPDLLPFIDTYDIALRRAEADPRIELRDEPNRLPHPETGILRSLGTYAAKLVEPALFEAADEREQRTNTIALIRGPRMVVRYHPVKPRSAHTYVGVFVGHEDAEEYLKLSEPPAHNEWNPEASRLKDEFGQDGASFVQAVLSRLRSGVSRWLDRLDPAPANSSARIDAIDRLFGQFLNSLGRGPQPPPPPNPDPIHLEVGHPTARPTEIGIRLQLHPRLCLREDAADEVVNVKVSGACHYLIDSDLRKGEPVPMHVSVIGGEESGLSVEVKLSKGAAPVQLLAETEEFDSRCAVDYEFSVVPV